MKFLAYVLCVAALFATPSMVFAGPGGGEPRMTLVSGTDVSVTVDGLTTVAVVLKDAKGKPIANASVALISNDPSTVSVSTAKVTTDSTGKAVFTVRGIAASGKAPVVLTVSSGKAVGIVRVMVLPAAAAVQADMAVAQ